MFIVPYPSYVTYLFCFFFDFIYFLLYSLLSVVRYVYKRRPDVTLHSYSFCVKIQLENRNGFRCFVNQLENSLFSNLLGLLSFSFAFIFISDQYLVPILTSYNLYFVKKGHLYKKYLLSSQFYAFDSSNKKNFHFRYQVAQSWKFEYSYS